ncbi:anthranilate phosphoribosyltransferase [Streptomyces sp. NY05-11A]|uniref:anthranilate phosphoribosyltransferase n=1 Tax=Streptomyces soliscabiei TaxID=588897 RepID=UPI0029B010FD|nr:hypothetical protein [Streptomyces sp. NY05-11A]MDX2680453.1 hypothetical protein [Streptomyces sp. NY05-11A]
MHEAVVSLIGRVPVELPVWRSFWDRLHCGGLLRGEAAALLASLSTEMPGRATLHALLESLDERRPAVNADAFAGAVNIVGTGGGPATFNISTAAALVAAAMGVPVVKTGSRAYTSRWGSLDLLTRLGITPTTSFAHTQTVLEHCGIAFAGLFVYPPEIALLARAVAPLGLRALGPFVNALGPFLAGIPTGTQVTGVSRPRHLEGLRHAAGYASRTGRTVWLAVNDAGADELLGFRTNTVHVYEGGAGTEFTLSPGPLGLGTGELADLAVPDGGVEGSAALFLDVLAGRGNAAAHQTVCLNAAALAVAGRYTGDWHQALAAADDVLRSGGALDRLERLRSLDASHA